jgi:hypothetical protein
MLLFLVAAISNNCLSDNKKNLNYKWAYSYSLIYSPKDRPSHHGERPKDWK